jgi:cation transport ATPase
LNEAGEFMRNIRQNLGFAFVYNAAGVPVSVIGNALRLARTKLD